MSISSPRPQRITRTLLVLSTKYSYGITTAGPSGYIILSQGFDALLRVEVHNRTVPRLTPVPVMYLSKVVNVTVINVYLFSFYKLQFYFDLIFYQVGGQFDKCSFSGRARNLHITESIPNMSKCSVSEQEIFQIGSFLCC